MEARLVYSKIVFGYNDFKRCYARVVRSCYTNGTIFSDSAKTPDPIVVIVFYVTTSINATRSDQKPQKFPRELKRQRYTRERQTFLQSIDDDLLYHVDVSIRETIRSFI